VGKFSSGGGCSHFAARSPPGQKFGEPGLELLYLGEEVGIGIGGILVEEQDASSERGAGLYCAERE